MKRLFGVVVLMLVAVMVAPPAQAFVYLQEPGAVRERELGRTGFLRERLAWIEPGDTLSGRRVCSPFTQALQEGFGVPTTAATVACWELIKEANGLESYDRIIAGQLIWLPDPSLVGEFSALTEDFRNQVLFLVRNGAEIGRRILLLSGDVEQLQLMVNPASELSLEVLEEALRELNQFAEEGETPEELANRLDSVVVRLNEMDARIRRNTTAIATTNERVNELEESTQLAVSTVQVAVDNLRNQVTEIESSIETRLGAVSGRLDTLSLPTERPFDTILRWAILVFGIVILLALLAGVAWRSQHASRRAQFTSLKETADSATTTATEAHAMAETAVAVANKAQTVADTNVKETKGRIDRLTDRVRDVEEVQALHLTLDAQERFHCPDLDDHKIKSLEGGERLTLSVECADNVWREVQVVKGFGGDGKTRLFLLGLKPGHDFVDTISLSALYRHLVQARQQRWIIGLSPVSKKSAA